MTELTKLKHATIHGEIDPEILAEEIEIGFSAQGEKTKPGKWMNMTVSILEFLTLLSDHKVGEKDGFCITQGKLLGGERKSIAVAHEDLLILDLDTGETLQSIHKRVKKLGYLALVYTTHSHQKEITEVRRDVIVKWLGDDEVEPDVESVMNYLRDVKRYEGHVLKDAELLETEHKATGVMMRLKHQPMTKARVVFILDKRYSFSNAKTQVEAITIWKERYYGTARTLDTFFDRSCADPARLFFTPRHKKGAEFQIDIFPGELLPLDEMPRITAAEIRDENPWESAARKMKGGQEYETPGLLYFFGKYADRFQIDDFLLEVDPEGRRAARASGPGHTHMCPNDGNHSNAGDSEDAGFICINALDAENQQALALCRHDSCSKLDRINFTDLACVAAGITDAKELRRWVPELEGDEAEDDDDAPKAAPKVKYDEPSEARAAIAALSADDDDAAADVARLIGGSAFTAVQVDGLVKAIRKKTGLGVNSLKSEVKKGMQAVMVETAKGGSSVLDTEEQEALERFNKKYALVTLGSKVRVLEEPRVAGSMPALFELDSWKLLEQNHRIPSCDSDGTVKLVPVTGKWLDWPDRRTYRGGIAFEPNGCSRDSYNLWKGFPIKSRKGNWDLLRSHIYDNICDSNPEYFNWVMTWFSQMWQNPGEKMGSALVIKGRKGTGKSKVFDWIRKGMGQHAIQVSQKGHITGNFNGHQAGIILMVCEEAFWAGDTAAGGVLKNLITSPTMMMEKKGVDAIEVNNLARLAMISNEEWVVPAGLSNEERRFMVLECNDDRIGDTAFFASIDEEMESGGLEAMVWEFEHWIPADNNWNVLRKPPATAALREQSYETLDATMRFFTRMVQDGGLFHKIPEDLPAIELKEEKNEINFIEFRTYFEFFMKGARFNQGKDHAFKKAATKFLLAEESFVKSSGEADRERRLVCPPISVIRAHIATFGVDQDKIIELDD